MAGIVATIQSFFNVSAPGKNHMEERLFQSTRGANDATDGVEH